MGKEPRRGSDSRCCDETIAPLTWLDYVDPHHVSVVSIADWLETLKPWSREIEQGQIDDLMEAASNGELWDSGDEKTKIKPIRENPEIFELRHTALSKKLRFYHGEPVELPSALVALHRHIKTNNADQQTEILYASERFIDGRDQLWQ